MVNDSSFPSFHSDPGLLGTFRGPRRYERTTAPRGTSSETLDTYEFCLAFRKLLIVKVNARFLNRVFCFLSVWTYICEKYFLYSCTRSLFDSVVAHWLEGLLWGETDLDSSLGPGSVLLGWLLHSYRPQFLIYNTRLAPTCPHGCGEDKMNQTCRVPRTVLSPE